MSDGGVDVEVNPFEGGGEETGGIVDIFKKLAQGSKVLSNNRSPKAYAYCFNVAKWEEQEGKGLKVFKELADLDREFAKDCLDLECGLVGKNNRAKLLADSAKANLEQEFQVERRAGGAFG